MVQGKKVNDMSNGTNKYQPSNMAFQRNNLGDPRAGSAGKSDGKPQNGNANFFRTDTAISGSKVQGERPLQRWVDDGPAPVDGSLESGRNSKSTGVWDQFAENERRFGVKTDYDENIYTMPINKNDPQYKQRVAVADKIAKEIEHSVATNSHVAEERIIDNVGGDDGVDEEEKYSGVRRQQDFPPLGSLNNNNKYTPPARRAPTGQATVSGAPVDPAIISSQLARPDKPAAERPKPTVAAKASKPEVATPPTTTESSFSASPDTKATLTTTPSSSSRTASPQVKPEGVPNATATVERDVTNAFKTFATRERRVVENARMTKAKNDKEIKLNDLKKFADSFKLHTPVPSDLVPIIAKDPAKQKEIQEKARRNAEESKAHAPEAAKPIAAVPDAAKPAQRPAPGTHGTSPANLPNRQNPGRNSAFVQGTYNSNQSFNNRGSNQASQPQPAQTNRQPGNLGARLRNIEQSKHQLPSNPIPIHETRLPPTGPANNVDPNFSRRSSGVASVGPAARLNPNSIEFRPSPNAPSFSPNGNPSTGSSPRSALNTTSATPVTRSLLKRKPIPESERPSIKGRFNALEHIKTFKPGQGKDWKATGGLKPAYDTPPIFRQVADDEKSDSTMQMTYQKMFEVQALFPAQTMSSPNPAHAIPQVPHQHQLPFHLQQGVHNNMASRQSPRQPPMNLHGSQHVHGPALPFNGHDEHRMMPSHSAQSYASPRLQNVPMAYPSPMNQNAQLAFPQMMPFASAPPMQPQMRSFSQSHQFMPQQGQMGPIMMPNPAGSFLTSQGMAPGPQMMYQQGGQGPFMPSHNGPPVMPANGFPSPGRGAPMMMNQGSQQGHQQPMYGMNPGMSPGPQYVAPMYPQQPPGQMPMRGYGGPNQFGTSPQQMHQYGPQQHRNNHQNGNNYKNFQQHGQHPNGPANNQIPTGPQVRASEGSDETK